MSLLLILGSPLLAAYSLSLTVLNASWISRTFRQLRERSRYLAPPGGSEKEDIFDSIRQILIEVQHVPIKVVLGENYDFAQMVIRPENKPAWVQIAREIFKTKREKTLSLITQLLWVVLSQVLSIIQYFTTGADDNSVFLGLAVNSLWAWMLPLVWGWVHVGTQRNATSIRDAIEAVIPPRVIKLERGAFERSEFAEEEGETDTTEDQSLEEKIDSCNFLVDRTDEADETDIASFYGFPIAGWEKEPGPLFVFSRVHTHIVACEHIRVAFDKLLKREEEEKSVDRGSWDDFEANIKGLVKRTTYYGLQKRSRDVEASKDFSVHTGAPGRIGFNLFVSCLVGFFLQWGTTGSAILIAYK
jgi:hypothetical protein